MKNKNYSKKKLINRPKVYDYLINWKTTTREGYKFINSTERFSANSGDELIKHLKGSYQIEDSETLIITNIVFLGSRRQFNNG